MESVQSAIVFPRQPILHNTFVLGVVVTLLVGTADGLLARAGMQHDVGRLVFMGVIDAVVVWWLAETWRPAVRTLAMFVSGGILGAGYFVANYAHEQIHISAASQIDYVYYFVYAALIAPVFEEAVVRRWMFFGAAEWMGATASALLVSALFALTHSAIPIYAFVFSLGMCWLAYRGVKTLDRAMFHGSHNLILQGLLVFYAS